MICRIEGCLHRSKRPPSNNTRHIGQSWYDYLICTCCGIEFFPEKGYMPSWSCTQKIKKELEIIPRPIDLRRKVAIRES